MGLLALYRKRILFDRDIRECVRAAGDACLLREQPIMEKRSHANVSPPTVPRTVWLWGHQLRDGGAGSVYSIDRAGRRAYHESLPLLCMLSPDVKHNRWRQHLKMTARLNKARQRTSVNFEFVPKLLCQLSGGDADVPQTSAEVRV